MSTLSTLKTRLSEVLKKSETRNLTDTQRERALNDALIFDVANYRPWTRLIKNDFTQAVSGVINIPSKFRKEYSLHYGASPTSSWERYEFIDQTKFLDQIHNTATITDDSGSQVLKVHPTTDQGVEESNQTSDTDLGLYDDAAREQVFQTFTIDGTTLKGAMLKLKVSGTISTANTLTLGLYATSSSLPTGSALVTDTLSTDEIGSSYEFFFFYLPYTTTADTEYALVLSTDASAADTTNYVNWEYSATDQTDDATRGVYDGTDYTTATGDMYFLTYSEVYNFQYSEKLVSMASSASDSGLSSEFDEAIVMLAAARLLSRQAAGRDQVKLQLTNELRYGTGGNKFSPTDDSAYGKLNIIWDEYRLRTRRPRRKMTNIYENRRSGTSRGSHSDRTFLDYLTRRY